ncbi:ATP-binding protein [Streptomyces sp. NBC_00838]|uniref:ATP-binding protein n=1 Tax=Streptomyces sp. NBC_00838 TaxID=2903680 RepID=UPI003864C56F
MNPPRVPPASTPLAASAGTAACGGHDVAESKPRVGNTGIANAGVRRRRPPGGRLPRLQICLGSGPAAFSEARRTLRECLVKWGLEPFADSAVLAAQECLANAVLHGCQGVEPGEFEVTLTAECRTSALWIGVQDPSTELPLRRDAGVTSESGRGLCLVAVLTDGWGTTPSTSGKTVWFELDISGRKAAL